MVHLLNLILPTGANGSCESPVNGELGLLRGSQPLGGVSFLSRSHQEMGEDRTAAASTGARECAQGGAERRYTHRSKPIHHRLHNCSAYSSIARFAERFYQHGCGSTGLAELVPAEGSNEDKQSDSKDDHGEVEAASGLAEQAKNQENSPAVSQGQVQGGGDEGIVCSCLLP